MTTIDTSLKTNMANTGCFKHRYMNYSYIGNRAIGCCIANIKERNWVIDQ